MPSIRTSLHKYLSEQLQCQFDNSYFWRWQNYFMHYIIVKVRLRVWDSNPVVQDIWKCHCKVGPVGNELHILANWNCFVRKYSARSCAGNFFPPLYDHINDNLEKCFIIKPAQQEQWLAVLHFHWLFIHASHLWLILRLSNVSLDSQLLLNLFFLR